jgi:TonB family protein
MKPTAGYAKPRRTAVQPRTRLNLQRRPKPGPEEDIEQQRNAGFWKCVVLIALVHFLVILGVSLYYLFAPAKEPEPDFITLLPKGDTVIGKAGKQEAHKIGAPQTAIPSHHSSTPPPTPAHVTPPTPKPVTPPQVVKPPPTPTPIIKDNAPAPAPVKPVKPVKPKPVKPKVKVDLNEVDRTETTTETPPKPAQHHEKKPVKTPDKSNDDTSHETSGLTHQQIMDKLGDKLDPSGAQNAKKFGADGAPDGHASNFQDFYLLIRDQVRDAWSSPMTPAETKPIVSIHVEPSGHISPDSVHLVRSSGDAAYDQAAIDTVKRVNQLREPLPKDCPPDITITFDPNPSQ